MASTNISIKQSTGVAINVAVLKAITVETLQAIKQCVLRIMVNGQCSIVNGQWSIVNGQWSITRLYRHQLRMARAVARVIDAHPTLSNIALWLMGIALAFEVFMFA